MLYPYVSDYCEEMIDIGQLIPFSFINVFISVKMQCTDCLERKVDKLVLILAVQVGTSGLLTLSTTNI